jgi:AcrR family transcriptional regulator
MSPAASTRSGQVAEIKREGRRVVEIKREGGHVVEMQRRRLLLAMQELAGEDGLERVSVGRVCKRARVSRRTFYDLFDDRDACFLAAFEQALERLGESAIPAHERPARWCERVRAGLEALLIVLDEQPRLARLCVIETLKGGPAVLARRRELLDALAAVVDEGRDEARAGSGPPVLTAESTVGGALAVIHARLPACLPPVMGAPRMGDPASAPLIQLAPSLAAMIVLPYLGTAASKCELERPVALPNGNARRAPGNGEPKYADVDPFRDLRLRFTYRTARVLATIATHPGASNRHIGEHAGVSDQGQISKLLKRLERAGLLENGGPGRESGEANVWQLTARGQAIETALGAGRVGS